MVTQVPINAKVQCKDGECGEVVTLVFNPLNKKLTNVVVKYNGTEYLVPMEFVVETTPKLVKINCLIEDVTRMEVFSEVHYIETTMPMGQYYAYNGGMGAPYYADPYVSSYETELPVEEIHIPSGFKMANRGMNVEATDGHVGKVGELVVDPKEGTITHFTLMESNLLSGKAEATLPISAIDHTEPETIYLKLSKADIKLLPVLPLKHSRGYKSEDSSFEIVAIRFDTADKAEARLKEYKDLEYHGYFKLANAVIFVRDEQGVLTIKETGDMTPKKGTRVGAVMGGIVGLIGGPAGVVAGAAIGGGVGRTAAKKIDMGFNNDFLQLLGEKLKPGQSGLLITVEHMWRDKFIESLSADKEVFSQQTMTDRLVEQLVNPPAEEEK
jgi:uncharacterized membrane protein